MADFKVGTQVRVKLFLPRTYENLDWYPAVGDIGIVKRSSETPYGDGCFDIQFDEGLFLMAGRELEEVTEE